MAVFCTIRITKASLEQAEDYVIAANNNSPNQTVIAGQCRVQSVLPCKEKGFRCKILPVSHAFHSKIVAPATELAQSARKQNDFSTKNPNDHQRDGILASDSPEAIIDTLTAQVTQPVEWIQQIENMYAAGARVFVECGPQRVLTGLSATS